jgi:hypothetical protein
MVLVLLAAVLVPAAQADRLAALAWSRYDVDIQLQTDGTFIVTETQAIDFGSQAYHFGRRVIPQARGAISNVKVWEDAQSYTASPSNQPYTFTASKNKSGDLEVIWYFPYTSNSSHTYYLQYTVRDGLLYYPDQGYDRIQWKAIPPDHDYAIAASKITARTPSGAPVQLVGVAYGDPAEATIGADHQSAVFESTRVVAPRQGIEIRADFQHGVVAGSAPAWQFTYDLKDRYQSLIDAASLFLGALIAIGGSLLVFLRWYTAGRDPQAGLAAQYVAEPPGDLPPGIVGTLVDERADMQDIIATVIDLARRGFVTMEEQQTPGFMGIGATRDFIFRRASNADTSTLREYERRVLNSVFSLHDETKLSELKYKFYQHISAIDTDLYKEVVKAGLFPVRPDTVRTRWGCGGIALLVLAIAGGVGAAALFKDITMSVVIPFVGLGAVAVAVASVGAAMPVKSRKGSEAAALWRAFKQYLSNLERYTKVQDATDQFDKYLPYAIAFGIERSWINKFARVAATPIPPWYLPYGYGRHYSHGGPTSAGSGGFGGAPSVQGMSDGLAGSLQTMSNGLTSMLNSAASTFRSTPSSSGSHGGWGGGGFSGGGGGGGGSAGFG